MITGSIVAIITPMHRNGDVDYPALEKLIEFHIANDTQGIVAVGTTGESPTLTIEENIQVIQFCIDKAKGRIPIIAGTGSNSTAEAIEMTQAAKDVGADASLLVVPYYNKPPQEAIYQHFKAIAESIDMPHILYNVPHRTVADMSNETTLRLAQIDNIVGIKDATGDLERGRELCAKAPKDFALYSGEDKTAHDLILHGGHGVISVTANIAPKLMQAMCVAAKNHDQVALEAAQKSLMALHDAIGVQPNPMPVKWALMEMGYVESGIRLPLIELQQEFHDGLRAALKAQGLMI